MLVIKETNNINNMRTVNFEEKVRKINEFRLESLNKSFTRNELEEVFRERGITCDKTILFRIIQSFPHEKLGHTNLYEIPKTPVHISLVKAAWEKKSKYNKSWKSKRNISIVKEDISEDSALELLRSKGYQIKKCVGFDLERFQKENPVLYKKYLKYEII